MAASYPTSVKSFSAVNDGDTISDEMFEEAYDEITAMQQALVTTGLAHHLKFVDATYDIGQSGATRPRHLYMSGTATIGGDVVLGANGSVRRSTSDGSDNGSVTLAGGGSDDDARGGRVTAYGNEHATLPGHVVVQPGNVANADVVFRRSNGSDVVTIDGASGNVTFSASATSFNANFVEFSEMSDPSAPSADTGRIYMRDNGSGKTQFVARFPSGAVQPIATEP